MRTLRWSLPVIALCIAAGWLWSSTRALTPAPQAKSPPVSYEPAKRAPLSPIRVATPAPPERPRGEQIETRFSRERVDATWATATRSQLEGDLGRFATKDAGVRSVDCRASMCRVEVATATRAAGEQFAESWLRDRTFTGPAWGHYSDDAMVMYVGRDGTELIP